LKLLISQYSRDDVDNPCNILVQNKDGEEEEFADAEEEDPDEGKKGW